MARKPLSEERIKDAARLKSIWESFKAKEKVSGVKISQDDVANACGWTTQGAFSAYVNANTPLNLDALIKLSIFFDVSPSQISPELAKWIELVKNSEKKEANARFNKFMQILKKIDDALNSEKIPAEHVSTINTMLGMIDHTLGNINELIESWIKPDPKSNDEAKKTA